MIPYVVLLIFPIIVQHVRISGLSFEKKNKAMITFFFVFLTILIIFRHESVGNDTQNYMHYFDRNSKTSWKFLASGDVEFGFAYFNKIISLISGEPRFFLATSAVVTSAMIYPTYKRLCTDSSLTIVLFCIMSTFVMMFSGIRQMLAVGVGFIAYEFVRNKRIVPFIITVCLAMTFHISAFMLAFMYPLYHVKITKKSLIVVLPILSAIFVFNRPIFSFLSVIIEENTKYDASITSTGAYTMLIIFIVFAVFAFLIPEKEIDDSEILGLRNFLLMSVIIQMFAPLHNLAMRMNYYYIIFIPLLLPKIIEHRSKRWSQVAIVSRHVMVIFFLMYFFLINPRSGGNLNVFPYRFLWEGI